MRSRTSTGERNRHPQLTRSTDSGHRHPRCAAVLVSPRRVLRVIALVRRSKKRSVASAVERDRVGTTAPCARCAICPVAARLTLGGSIRSMPTHRGHRRRIRIQLDRKRSPSKGLGRRISERTKYGIHTGLIACTLSLKPFKYILIKAQRNQCLRRYWLKTPSNDAANNVLHIGLGMFFGRNTFGPRRSQAGPVSLRFLRSRGWLHVSWLCGRR
jgi:hypothetical protein